MYVYAQDKLDHSVYTHSTSSTFKFQRLYSILMEVEKTPTDRKADELTNEHTDRQTDRQTDKQGMCTLIYAHTYVHALTYRFN